MKKDLLVCIAFHWVEGRMDFLKKVLTEFADNYACSMDIIVDTNNPVIFHGWRVTENKDIKFFSHANLQHPFHLAWKHRKHILDNIDKYENFMYIEDDILLPYENYLNYLENFKLLFPKYIPSFVRIEENGGTQFITDATQRQSLEPIDIGDKRFAELKNPYHGFWIMPAKQLKETMIPNFVRLHESRETAASYPMWELKLTPLVEIENGQISKKCYSYHLPNNYAASKDSPYAKIKVNEIFI